MVGWFCMIAFAWSLMLETPDNRFLLSGQPVITVCEAVCGEGQYDGEDIYLVGRYGGAYEGSWLEQRNCPCVRRAEGSSPKKYIEVEYDSAFAPAPDFESVVPIVREKFKTGSLLDGNQDQRKWVVAFGTFRRSTPTEPPEAGGRLVSKLHIRFLDASGGRHVTIEPKSGR